MTRILNKIVDDKQEESTIEGIVVFGSYVKRSLHKLSDLDLFVLDSSLNNYDHTRKNQQSVTVEYYRWPTPFFQSILYNDTANIYPKAFLFKILREGHIKYDPLQILHKARVYARVNALPHTSITSLLQSTRNSLEQASLYINNQQDLFTEIELRISSENLGRLLLLQKQILDINPPKYYLPSLREAYPDFYDTFCVIHNLLLLEPPQIEKNIGRLKTWISTFSQQNFSPKNDRDKSTKLTNAKTELANAEDCFRCNDYQAAELQTRYAALYLAPHMFHQNDLGPSEFHTKITRRLQCNHAYQQVLLSILNCYMNRSQLQYYLDYLRQLTVQMN
jgi:hypothetical protein